MKKPNRLGEWVFWGVVIIPLFTPNPPATYFLMGCAVFWIAVACGLSVLLKGRW